jgi:general L-amino acid transport system permease protein
MGRQRQLAGCFWYSRRFRSLLFQAAVAVMLVVVIGLVVHTTAANLARLNMASGFGFLRQHAGFQIGETLIDYDPSDSYLRAICIGGLNTLLVSALACTIATVIGTLVGVMRLAPNPLLRRFAFLYVTIFRNTPLLLQMMLWYVLLQALPPIRQALSVSGVIFLSQRGLWLPSLSVRDTPGLLALAGIAAGLALMAVSVTARIRLRPAARRLRWAAGIVLLPACTAAFIHGHCIFALEFPARRGFNFEGGIQLSPEFTAVLTGLALYYAAYTAEIVRGGILAVPAGQWEASRALGLSRSQALRHIVGPQALRVAIPPLTLEYVGIIKGSSIGILVGYPELFWAIGAAIGQTGHAVEGVALLMLAYLIPSLAASIGMNAFNRRLLRRGFA